MNDQRTSLHDTFPAMFPSPTKGNGLVRPNNIRTGGRQPEGVASFLRKVSCAQCGMLNSLNRVSPSGGDLGGDGAFSGNTLSGTSVGFDLQGEGQLQIGSGCSLCGSKNFASPRVGN